MSDFGFLLGKNATVVCLGDSITEAVDGYVSLMRNLITAAYPERNIRTVNAGGSGNRAPDMLNRLQRDVISQRPNCVTISVGVNDVWHAFRSWNPEREHPNGDSPNGVPLASYEAYVGQMVDTLREATDADIILITPTLIGEDIDNPDNAANARLELYADAMRRVASSRQAILADARADFVATLRAGRAANPEFRLTTDGVHLNPIGNAALALTVLAALGFAGLAG